MHPPRRDQKAISTGTPGAQLPGLVRNGGAGHPGDRAGTA
jgi:hypothetical protein